LEIEEPVRNSLRANGWCYIIPPVGYNILGDTTHANVTNNRQVVPNIGGLGGLSFTATGGLLATTAAVRTDLVAAVRTIRVHEVDRPDQIRTALAVQLGTFEQTQRLTRGTIAVNGLVLQPIFDFFGVWDVDNVGTELSVSVGDWAVVSHNSSFGPLVFDSIIATAGTVVGDDTAENRILTMRGLDPDGVALATNNNARINTAGTALRRAADRRHWDIEFTATTPPDRYSGFINQGAATVTLNSRTLNSWIVERDTFFTLVDEDDNDISHLVKITRVVVSNGVGVGTATGRQIHEAVRGVDSPTAGYQLVTAAADPKQTEFWNRSVHATPGTANVSVFSSESGIPLGGYNGTPRGYSHVAFDRDGGTVILRDLRAERNQFSRISVQFFLSAHPNFEGKVYVKVSGGGIEESHPINRPLVNINTHTQHIATFWRPLAITAETTDVQIGYLEFKVADVT
jgi:hypothetical protein